MFASQDFWNHFNELKKKKKKKQTLFLLKKRIRVFFLTKRKKLSTQINVFTYSLMMDNPSIISPWLTQKIKTHSHHYGGEFYFKTHIIYFILIMYYQ